MSFDANDPSINYVRSGAEEVRNKAGLFGAYAAGLLDDFFGVGAIFWPVLFAVLGFAQFSARVTLRWWRWCGIFLLTICFLMLAAALDLRIGDLEGGGMVGRSLLSNSMLYLSPPGSFLLWLFVFLAGLQMVANISWIALNEKMWHEARARFASFRSRKKGPEQKAGKHSWQERCKLYLEDCKRLAWQACDWLLRSIAACKRAPEPEKKLELANAFEDDDPFTPVQKMQPEIGSITAIHAPAESSQTLPEAQTGEAPEESGQGDEYALEQGPGEQPEQESENWQGGNAEPSPAVFQIVKAPTSMPAMPRVPVVPHTPAHLALPSVELLEAPGAVEPVSQSELERRGQALMNCFNDFDVQGELAGIVPGPVVTMFEFRPAPGIRVSKIANLSDDLSLALKAVAVRIQAPIPGTDTVGIEIPNEKRELVNFRELVETRAFAKGAGPLTMILGKDIAGAPYMADLTRMPHMLVAGATGAGKSVCLNSILISLLYRMPPDRLKLLLIDPKRIEMAVYADLPHLVHPVVTEMEDATNALAWAVEEMENRFKTFMRIGVRNIAAYHEKLESFHGQPPENLADLEPLPYMVIVIDELADLMLTAAREVEGKIQRLAQLARAAGIHMILATQRPSVDVVTGLIKAQFPCRISFQVSSKHDSRTILDQIGAEHLLGRGDMLFKPPGAKLLRLHGPFLKDEEVQAVVSHWRSQQAPDYKVDFSKWGAENATSSPSIGGDATSDELYGQARAFVLEQGRASISLLQRHLKIGFNRAARLMEQFERDGIIGPADGSKPRVVIR